MSDYGQLDRVITEVTPCAQDKTVCQECGSTNIMYKAWLDVNTNKYIDEYDDDVYCNDCDDYVDGISEKDYLESKDE